MAESNSVTWYDWDSGKVPEEVSYSYLGMGDTPGTNRWLCVAPNHSASVWYDGAIWHFDVAMGGPESNGDSVQGKRTALEEAKAAVEATIAGWPSNWPQP